MIKTFFHTAFRNIKRRKGFAFINIMGLTIGLVVSGVVALYIHHELTYDSFHHNAEKTFRISAKTSSGWFAALPRPYSDVLYENPDAGIQHVVRFRRWFTKYIKYDNEKFFEEKILVTDPGSKFFAVFNFEAAQGNLQTALQNPGEAVITESVKKKIFGDTDPIGQVLQYDTITLRVTAVLKDLPTNSHIDLRILFTNAPAMAQASGMFTYAVFNSPAEAHTIGKKIMSKPVVVSDYDKIEEVKVLPLKDLHFKGNMTYELKTPGSMLYLFIFATIGCLIFAICCSNYINLSVAIYAERHKEIAIRKVSGAGNMGLAIQFWGESILLSLLSVPLALDLIEVTLPFVNERMDIQLRNEFLHSFKGFLLFLSFATSMGFLAGIYPALVMPRMNCLSLFKKHINAGREGIGLRKSIVLFQFTLIILLATAAWFVQGQLNFVHSTDLGFDKESVIKLSKTWSVDSISYQRLKQKLVSHNSILSVTHGLVPGDEDYGIPVKGEGSEIIFNDALYVNTDTDYINTLGIQALEGEYFDQAVNERPTRSVLVNETMLKRLGYDTHVGKKIVLWPGNKNERVVPINGVVKDYHFYSLHQPITPQMLFIRQYSKHVEQNILVKIESENIKESLNFIQATINEIIPDIPVQLEFLDSDLKKFYEQENRLAAAINILFVITILLSIAALVGLSSYIMLLRTKEIGVRKVLGASTMQLISVLSKEFLLLMIIAFAIGSALSFVILRQWLNSFAYKIDLEFWIFVLIGLSATVLTLLTVSYQSYKASSVNPVQSLRNE